MVETRVTIMRPGAADEERFFNDLPPEPGFHALNRILTTPDLLGEGTDIEHVSVLHDRQRLDMFVDETGALKKLPVNAAATKIYHAATLARMDNVDTKKLPKIYGTAVLFHRRVWT